MGDKCIYCGKETVEVVKTFRKVNGKRLLRPKSKGRVVYWCYNCKRHSVDYDLRTVNKDNGIQKTIQDSQ